MIVGIFFQRDRGKGRWRIKIVAVFIEEWREDLKLQKRALAYASPFSYLTYNNCSCSSISSQLKKLAISRIQATFWIFVEWDKTEA